jgi:predicted TIM-barrel fold metal-dependent hydrolase
MLAGMPGVVDSHVHLLPEGLARAIRSFFDAHHYDTSTFAYPLDHHEVCRRLAADGVTSVWSLPYARRPGTAARLNESMAAAVIALASAPLEVLGGATVHPADEAPAEIVRRAVEDSGARVLKLHCSVGDFAADDRRLDPVWAYVSEIALPVVVHAGHASTGRTTATDIGPIGVVAERWPEVRLIVAHCGYPASEETLDLVAAYPHVYADLTPVVVDLVEVGHRRLTQLSAKILFGSDAPNTALTAGDALGHLRTLGLRGAALDQVTGGTARRLQADIRT